MADAAFAALHRRLATRFSPEAWIGFVASLLPAQAHERGPEITRTPEHFLGALWAPLGQGPERWPEAVVIGSPTADHALAQLFAHVPPAGKLLLVGRDAVDAALAAEILLAGDRNLEPYQRSAVEAFIGAERERTRALVAQQYTDRDAGFERFRARVLRGES